MPDIPRRRLVVDDGHDGERVAVGWARDGQHGTLQMISTGKPAGEWQMTVIIIAQPPHLRIRGAVRLSLRLP
jgi:hypothetical protein